ncbi:zinc finger MYM-type protein 4 isoform X2 [Denticeps clupeoides]|uniref:zinc finger MYM-type protein 4 isoform X2 n=1 Tax=Denticeps clupeoides TaxID=299321 RepID=UPI0010A3E04D|nr:zinc finger MYM-type protein 4-like isoform X2 [Denticeps clupeoides]
MAEPDCYENEDLVTQTFQGHSEDSAGEGVIENNDTVPESEACLKTTDGAQQGQDSDGDPDELDGLPVFGVDEEDWDMGKSAIHTDTDTRLGVLSETEIPKQDQSDSQMHEVAALMEEEMESSSQPETFQLRAENEVSNCSSGAISVDGPEEDQQHPAPDASTQTQNLTESVIDEEAQETGSADAGSHEKIKDEPIDEGYDVALLPQPMVSLIKQELDIAEEHRSTEQLRISSVYSVGKNTSDLSSVAQPSHGPSVPFQQPPTPPQPPASSSSMVRVSCSGCSKILQKGQTAFQRKGSNQLFCSTVCLTGFTLPPATTAVPKKSCYSCHKDILQPKDLIKVPVDNITREFCSQVCLMNFTFKKNAQASPSDDRDDYSKCSVCRRFANVEHEVTHLGSLHKLCSDSCFSRFCVSHNLTINCCEACGQHCSSSTGNLCLLQADDTLKKFCSSTCITRFRQKCQQKIQCSRCHVQCPAIEMQDCTNVQGITELFCTQKCQTSSSGLSGTPFPCTNCQLMAISQYHLAMPDGSIRNFCSYECVIGFQEQRNSSLPQDLMNGSTAAALSHPMGQPPIHQPTQRVPSLPQIPNPILPYVPAPSYGLAPAFGPGSTHNTTVQYGPAPGVPHLHEVYQQHVSPGSGYDCTHALAQVSCNQCSLQFCSKPQVLHYKGHVWLFCGKTCCEVFKRNNNVTALCEYCKLEKVVKDIIKFGKRLCNFCSDGCKLLFKHDLLKKTGSQCKTCAYCGNLADCVVSNHFSSKVEEFCSKECMSLYTVLFYEMARCDLCRKRGALREALRWGSEMRYFCAIHCLLNFCQQTTLNLSSITPLAHTYTGSASAPVSRKITSFSKEMPVIRGVVSLASALTGQPQDSSHAVLPGTLPTTKGQSKVIDDASTQTDCTKLTTPPRRLLKNKALMCKPLTEDQAIQCSLDTGMPHTNHGMTVESETGEKVRLMPFPVPVPVPVFLPVPMHMYTQYTPVPIGVPVLVPVPLIVPSKPDGTLEGTNDEEEGEDKLVSVEDIGDLNIRPEHRLARKHKLCRKPQEKLPPRKQSCKHIAPDVSTGEVMPSDCSKLNSTFGVRAWHSWIQWRNQQSRSEINKTSGIRTMPVKEDILLCCSSELSNSLYHFVREVKQPDGHQYTADRIFCFCLGIQKYLIDNDRNENIFTDSIFIKFATEITRMLRNWTRTVESHVLLQSCVEEDYLWQCKLLGTYSPLILLNTLLFFATKFFQFTTLCQHQHLAFAGISHCYRNTPTGKITYLRFSLASKRMDQTELPELPAGDDNEEDFEDLEMPENTENPLHCPIRLYEFYLSKCPKSVRNRRDVFYLQPEHDCDPSSPLWYSNEPLDSATLESLLARILTVRQVNLNTDNQQEGSLSDEST